MMDIETITGQSLEDFFRDRVPLTLFDLIALKLRVLKVQGRSCIGAFVFKYEDRYVFRVEDPYGDDKADIYISFIDVRDLILIIDAVRATVA